jgi:hypothetical protein
MLNTQLSLIEAPSPSQGQARIRPGGTLTVQTYFRPACIGWPRLVLGICRIPAEMYVRTHVVQSKSTRKKQAFILEHGK